MSRDDALRVLVEIATADGLSHGIVGALTVIVFVIMRAMLPVKSLAIVFAPGIYLGGLIGIFLGHHWNLVLTAEKEANVVALAAAGMIAGLLVMMLLARAFDALTRIRNPVGAKPA
jgi:hypothetical protein